MFNSSCIVSLRFIIYTILCSSYCKHAEDMDHFIHNKISHNLDALRIFMRI